MIAHYLDMRGRCSSLGFLFSFITLALLGTGIALVIEAALHNNHHLSGIIIFLEILTGILLISIVLTQAIKRVNDMGRAGILSVLSVFPALVVLCLWLFGAKAVFSGPLLAVVVLGAIGLLVMLLPGKNLMPDT